MFERIDGNTVMGPESRDELRVSVACNEHLIFVYTADVKAPHRGHQEVIDVREEGIRAALIAQGWTPPEEGVG